MAEEQFRLKKLDEIQGKMEPYPARCQRSHACQQVILDFEKISAKDEKVTLVGRLVLIRLHGKACFAHLEDGTGRMQIYFKYDNLGPEAYDFFVKNIDVGDFLEVEGKLFITHRGEKTLIVSNWRLLAKAILPLPEKWHGLADIETRYRQRYLDLIANKEVRENFIKRSNIIKLIREFFSQKEFLEVATPILQPIPGGANAKPFVTHHNALDIDLYLRIAPELYLKRLIVGGLEKVYEIATCFRNEGIDFSHNPEFTQIEFYQAFADYTQLMKLTEDLLEFLVTQLFSKLEIEYQGQKINFKPPYPRLEFRQAILEASGIDIDEEKDLKQIINKARKIGLDIDKTWNRGKILDEIYKELVLPKIINPTFIINHPVEISPLAKRLPDNPNYVERFQLLIAGFEVCNAFSELNDPIDQEERFADQQKLRKAGDEEAQRLDEDFIEALKYGMPPTAGEGIGIDRLTMLLTNNHNIREVILFPTLRPK